MLRPLGPILARFEPFSSTIKLKSIQIWPKRPWDPFQGKLGIPGTRKAPFLCPCRVFTRILNAFWSLWVILSHFRDILRHFSDIERDAELLLIPLRPWNPQGSPPRSIQPHTVPSRVRYISSFGAKSRGGEKKGKKNTKNQTPLRLREANISQLRMQKHAAWKVISSVTIFVNGMIKF